MMILALKKQGENKQKISFENVPSFESFQTMPIDYSWSFSDKTQKDTAYITHSYYTYPAKFIPQLASRLIKEHSKPLDIVVDPFMGSGTTMVEALIHKRICFGVDINEIAYLVAKVKATPLDIGTLQKEYNNLAFMLNQNSLFDITHKQTICFEKGVEERIDYWFKPKQKQELLVILTHILDIVDKNLRDFFLVAFAQILKICSIWLQKSIKPTRDLHKKEANCYSLFLSQAKKMIKKHEQFNKMLDENVLKNVEKYLNLSCEDSRKLPLKDNEAQLIVTSPPYVTSYEYADLHQLPSLWLGFLDNLSEFRKKFIGSSFTKRTALPLKSFIAEQIIAQLKGKKAVEVGNYYADMLESFIQMHRVLKTKGRACIVIGNTQFKGVDILNAEVFCEQMQNIGFKIQSIIHRQIPSKMLPSTRDSKTGQFAKTQNTDKLVYPSEYILIMEK
ncbi:hypothetical protein DMC01_10425 [Campylobacter troglodytis]|nr:hypothetical protein DMC01_10425 [Campylobacter troglodytis]